MTIGLIGNFGHTDGLGHFYRLKSILDNFGKKNAVFYSQNDIQSNFLKQLKLNFRNIEEFDSKTLIYDGNHINSNIFQFLENVKRPRRLLLDAEYNKNNFFGATIIPSFFISKTEKLRVKKNFDKYHIGANYFFIKNYINIEKSDFPLVTFGGSDPNELTLLVAKALLNKAKYIIGPLFSEKQIVDLQKIINKDNLIYSPSETFGYIAGAPVVITALGTTLQEVELLQKKCLIITNYTTDSLHIESIKICSLNANNYLFHCYYKDFDQLVFQSELLLFNHQLNFKERLKKIDVKKYNQNVLANWKKIL